MKRPTAKMMKAPRIRRAVVYLRVSTDAQGESGLGLEAQQAACAAWCAARGYDVIATHTDEGVSGSTPIDKRDGLMSAVAALGRGSVLVAADRSRLSRSVGIAAVLEEQCRRMGAAVETPEAPESDDPFTIACRQMADVFAQLNLAQIRAKTKAALAAKRARGEKTGGALPFGSGLAADGKTLVIDPAEARVRELVAALRAEGLSLREIVARLNTEAVPCRGQRWHLTSVAKLVAQAVAA